MLTQSLRSPFENIFNIIGGLPQGHEKPMKHAFFNAIAMFLLGLCCAAGYALFLILEPFFKPLFWALLVGSILHPFKYTLSRNLKKWFDTLEKSNTYMVIGFAIMPLNIINSIADRIGDQVKNHYKLIGTLVLFTFVGPWLYNGIPRSCICLFWQIEHLVNVSMKSLIYICNSYLMFTVFFGYLLSVYVFWTPAHESLFRKTSLLMWVFFSSFLARLTGPFQVYVFIVLQILAVVGFVIEVSQLHKMMNEKGNEISIWKAINCIFLNKTVADLSQPALTDSNETETIEDVIGEQKDNIEKENSTPEELEIGESPTTLKRGSLTSSERVYRAKTAFKTRTISALPLTTSQPQSAIEKQILASLHKRAFEGYGANVDGKTDINDEEESTLYFKLLFWACGSMIMWKHLWLWPLLFLFLGVYAIKKIGIWFGLWSFLRLQFSSIMRFVSQWCKDRYSAVIPRHVRGIMKLIVICNTNIRKAAQDSIDTVSSCVVIVGLILFLICASIFIAVQIYSEAVVVIQLSGNVLNSTLVRNPELRGLLPEGWDDTLDSLLDNAYTYGREGISKVVKGVLKDADSEKSARLEQQVLELWDRIYQSWMSSESASHGPHVDSNAVQLSWDNFVNDITKSPGVLNYSGAVAWLQANVGTLTAIAGSLWAPLASNVSLLAGSLSAFASVLLGGGTAILNFVLSMVVFLTALFYLLASSNTLYKPIEVITQASPMAGPRLGIALSVAINQEAAFHVRDLLVSTSVIIHNCKHVKLVTDCQLKRTPARLESLELKSIGILELTNSEICSTKQIPDCVKFSNIGLIKSIPIRFFKGSFNDTDRSSATKGKSGIIISNSTIGTIEYQAFYKLVGLRDFKFHNVIISSIQEQAIDVVLNAPHSEFVISNCTIDTLHSGAVNVEAISAIIVQNKIGHILTDGIVIRSQYVNFSLNYLTLLKTESLSLNAHTLTISDNEFNELRTGAMLTSGCMEYQHLKSKSKFTFSKNIINLVEFGSFYFNAPSCERNSITIRNNEMVCKCHNLAWLTVQGIMGERFNELEFLNEIFLDIDNNNTCKWAPCYLPISVVKALYNETNNICQLKLDMQIMCLIYHNKFTNNLTHMFDSNQKDSDSEDVSNDTEAPPAFYIVRPTGDKLDVDLKSSSKDGGHNVISSPSLFEFNTNPLKIYNRAPIIFDPTKDFVTMLRNTSSSNKRNVTSNPNTKTESVVREEDTSKYTAPKCTNSECIDVYETNKQKALDFYKYLYSQLNPKKS